MKDIGIIGAGTAGLISALILKKRFPNINITIIKSDDVGIIGVGEGSTEHWSNFMGFCDFDMKQMLVHTGATFKYGVLFDGWTKEKYFHNVNQIDQNRYGQYLAGYGYAFSNNIKRKEFTSGFAFEDRIDVTSFPNQYHFDTFKLNNFLIDQCKLRNIKIIEDFIKDVEIKNNKIKSITGKKKYKFDFFVDATGFKRLLISKLGAKYKSLNEYLPMNEAIAFQTPDTHYYSSHTLAKAMDAGWMWRIPVQGRWGNGYVFDNNYMTAEKAKIECEKYLKRKIEIRKNIKFEAGTLDKFWIGNCCAIGLSGSFVEPMEASSIGTSIQQTFILMHMISNYSQNTINRYNKIMTGVIENIVDFVLLHYKVKKNNSKFWKNYKINLTDSLKDKLEIWKNRFPIREDFDGNYNLFTESNFAIVLEGIGHFDKNKIKYEYNIQNDEIKNITKRKMIDFLNYQKGKYYPKHKEFIETNNKI